MNQPEPTTNPSDQILDRIAEKLENGDRLDFADGVAMYEQVNLLKLGQLAEKVTFSRQGRAVYYSINRHINYTNICRINCSFCQFSRRQNEPDGYVMTPTEVAEQAA